jgi:hypothetical protein
MGRETRKPMFNIDVFNEALVKIAKDKLEKVFFSKTQLDYIASETSEKRLAYTLRHITRAALWEIATSDEITAYLKDTSLDQEEINEVKDALAIGIGIKSNYLPIDREELHQYYRNKIIKALETTEDRIRSILDEIKKPCEFDSVLGSIQNCGYVSSLPKRDRKAIHAEKKKYEKIKIETIERLKFLKLPYDAVEAKQYDNNEEFGWVNYEKTLKHIKQVLHDDLTLICGTGKNRADSIVKILEYI